MKNIPILVIVLVCLLIAAMLYGSIITARLINVKKEAQLIQQSRSSLEDELTKKEAILERQKELLDKLDSAVTVNDFIAVWDELQE